MTYDRLIIMNAEIQNTPLKWLYLGIPFIFIIGTVFHFLYKSTGKKFIVGLFVPVNESVWEHLKMLLLPIILWWGIYYSVKGRMLGINIDKWFFACLISLVTSMITMLVFYYTFTILFEIKCLPLNIFNLLFSVFMGQMLGIRFYIYSKGIEWYISATLIVITTAIFVLLTIFTPHCPILYDQLNKIYGIEKTPSE
jgi:hypothetical protein